MELDVAASKDITTEQRGGEWKLVKRGRQTEVLCSRHRVDALPSPFSATFRSSGRRSSSCPDGQQSSTTSHTRPLPSSFSQFVSPLAYPRTYHDLLSPTRRGTTAQQQLRCHSTTSDTPAVSTARQCGVLAADRLWRRNRRDSTTTAEGIRAFGARRLREVLTRFAALRWSDRNSQHVDIDLRRAQVLSSGYISLSRLHARCISCAQGTGQLQLEECRRRVGGRRNGTAARRRVAVGLREGAASLVRPEELERGREEANPCVTSNGEGLRGFVEDLNGLVKCVPQSLPPRASLTVSFVEIGRAHV